MKDCLAWSRRWISLVIQVCSLPAAVAKGLLPASAGFSVAPQAEIPHCSAE